MPPSYSEDLFDDTKMTIGEHLDELRGALFKSLLALVIGFIAAIYFTPDAVEVIQLPLREALERFYGKQEAERLAAGLAEKAGREEADASDLAAAADIVTNSGLISEMILVDPAELARVLGTQVPPEVAGDEALELRDRLIEMRIYRNLEDSNKTRIVGLSTQEPFFVSVKVALVLGFVVASPFIFFFVWEFVAAGLYPHEKGFVYTFLPFSLGLFLGGAFFAYFIVLNYVLDWLFWFNEITSIAPEPRMNEWLGFVLVLPVGFGLSFQLPLVMFFLERIGVMTVSGYILKWRLAVLVILVISMLLTPADPTSMILMALPLIALYFGGIVLCRVMPRRKTPFGESVD